MGRANILGRESNISLEKMTYSTILNKNSKILYNHKLTKLLMNKINLENYNLSKLGSVVIENLFTYDDKCSTNMINFLKKHNINQMDVDKLVKFNIYSKEYDAKYTSQYKRKLK